MNGILIVNKNIGNTSRDVVNEVSRCFKTKKVGHTGTLDPIASGVLVLCVGQALKMCEVITNHDKEYTAGVILGLETDTLDTDGKILNEINVNVTREEIAKVVSSFVGSYEQEVPKYSAVKVNGKKLYEYARANQDVPLPKKNVTIYNIELIDDVEYKNNKVYFKIKCTVGKGTYIRSLIRDIGNKLGCPATMYSLIRTRLGAFSLNMASTIDDIKNNNYKLLSIQEAFPNISTVVVDKDMAFKISNGVVFDTFFDGDMAFIVDENNKLLALYKNELDKARVFKMFT